MTILNCGGNAGGSGLPDPTSATAGDVLTLDSNKDAVWQTPSGGGTVTTSMNRNTFLDWFANANYGDRLDGVISVTDKNDRYKYSFAGSFVCTPVTSEHGGTQVGVKQFVGIALLYKADMTDDYSYTRYITDSFTINAGMNLFIVKYLYKSNSYSQIIEAQSDTTIEYPSSGINGISFTGRAIHYS